MMSTTAHRPRRAMLGVLTVTLAAGTALAAAPAEAATAAKKCDTGPANFVCSGEVRESWPTKTFTCRNMPKGTLKLTVSYEANTAIGMTW